MLLHIIIQEHANHTLEEDASLIESNLKEELVIMLVLMNLSGLILHRTLIPLLVNARVAV